MAQPTQSTCDGVNPTVPDQIYRLATLEITSVAILLLDERGCVVGWNQGAERLLGYTAAEVLGSSFERFFTPEDVRSGVPKRELRDATKGGAPDRNWIVRKDGSRFWGSGNTKAVRNSSGKVVCLVKVITDLTALHRLEVERAAALAREQAALAQAHAAEELRVADERFHVLVSNIADYAIFLLDPDGIIRSWNEGAERIKGYRESEIVGKNFAVFYTPEDRANGIPERNLRIAAAEGRLESEGWRIRKDGSRFWAHVVITALRDARGELTGFAKVTQDLTEKEQVTRDRLHLAQEQAARAAAEVAERRLAMQLSITRVLADTATLDEAVPRILQAIGEGLDWDWGTFWNVDQLANLLRCARVWHTPDAADSELEQAVRQLALAPGVGLPGRVWSTGQPVWIPDVVQDPGVALREAAARAGLHAGIAFPVMSGSEVLAVVAFYSGMVQPPNDELLALLKATGDEIGLVAERQRAKAQVEAERRWLRAVIENAPIGTLLVEGAEGRRVVANRKAKELFGHTLPPEGGIEQYIGQIYLPDGWPRPRSDLATVRALGGETVISEEEIVRQPTGREVRVLVSAVPIVRDGKIVGAVVVYEDITRIHELMRLREEWTSVITHDLRQPVTVILAYAGLLARTAGNQLGPRHQEYVEHVEVAARNLNKLIGDLLDESRIETGRLTLECETVDLGNLVREVTARMATSMGEHPIRLDLPDALPPISVDPSRVEQVLSNLLSNAAKYSYPDTEVVVSVQRQRDAVEVTVTNQGAGIPPEEIPHLFTRFYRTAEAQEGQVRGLGLGLYIARGLIEAHHGRIWVDSVPDKTTAFHFTLPIPEVVEATRPS